MRLKRMTLETMPTTTRRSPTQATTQTGLRASPNRMTPPIIEKKRVLLLTVCALATGVAPVACSEAGDNAGNTMVPYDAHSLFEGGNIFPPYDAYVETDSDVDDAGDADIADASDDAG